MSSYAEDLDSLQYTEMKHSGFDPAMYEYVLRNAVKMHPVQVKLREATKTMKGAMMQIPPDQGSFMQFLVKAIGAKKCIEVGVYTGYSTLSVALALPEDGCILALDINEDWTNFAMRYWKEAGVDHKIDLRVAPGIETLEQLLADDSNLETFDFAFIDADKSNYDEYYERIIKLLRVGGVIAIDNMVWGGRVADPKATDEDTAALRDLAIKLKEDKRVMISMLAIGDGVTLALKN